MIAIFPSLTRSVILFDFLDYYLPKRYLISDIKKALDAIPEMAYANNFPLNLENLQSSEVVFLLPETHHIDIEKILQTQSQRYKICAEYGQRLSDMLVQKYTHSYNQGRIFWFESELFNNFALTITKNAIDNIKYESFISAKSTRLFLKLCSKIRLQKPNQNYTKNTVAALPIANKHVIGLLSMFGLDKKVDSHLLCYLQQHSINRMTAAALVGMVATLSVHTLEKFSEKFGSKEFVISEYDSSIGSLLFHIQRSNSFFSLPLENAFKVGHIRYSESSKETTASLFSKLADKIHQKQIKNIPSLFVELIVTATAENHNDVRTFLVQQNILPKHTKIDVNNLVRLDANLLPTLKETDRLVAVALGLDISVESMTMH